MKYKNKLSICMMVKNEEKYLEKSLESLKPLFNNLKTELIIVDTGSEDNTVTIAKKYTEKLYFHEWDNNFGSMRNKTIQYATGEWILILDGDEIFKKIEPLIEFLNSSLSDKYNTASIIIKNVTEEKQGNMYQSADILRLFRNTKDFEYKGSIHEQPKFQNPVYFTDSEVLHYGYLSTDKELMEYKFKRNVELLEEELKKDPKNIYNWFQLSQSYGMYKDYRQSLESILRAYELVDKRKENHRNYLYVYNQLARTYVNNQRFNELEKICLKALNIEKKFIDFYYYLGVAQSQLNKSKEAIESFEMYLQLLDDSAEDSIEKKRLMLIKSTLGLYEDVCLNLCILYRRIGDKKEALKYIQQVTNDYMQKKKIPHLVELYIDLDMYDELKDEYIKVLDIEEDILHTFWISLDASIDKQEKRKKEKLLKLFSMGDCKYSLLNKVRLCMKENTDNRIQELIYKINELDFKSLPICFADVVYFLLINSNAAIGEILYNLRDYSIQSYLQYLINKYENELTNIILNYLEDKRSNRSFNEIKFQKVLNKSILILDKINEKRYQQVWKDYIADGVYYIHQVYNKNIIERESIYNVTNDEDAFFIYMFLAQEANKKDKVLYVKYLRKAIDVYPIMRKGIEILIKNLEEDNEESNKKSYTKQQQEEFSDLKIKVKENINILLKLEKITEAKLIIDEYLQIVPDDLEMLMLKSEIHLKLT